MTNDTTIGVTYIVVGTLGVIENALTAYLMSTDTQMKNPTYFYMIQLCLVDGLMLIPLMIYAGIVLLWPSAWIASPLTNSWASFLVDIIWHAGCPILILISISRYVQLDKSHKVDVYFTRRIMILSVIASWLVAALVFSPIVYAPERIFAFDLDLYTWEYARENAWGNGYFVWTQLVINGGTAILINTFNLLSLLSIRRRRMQIQQTVDTSGNFKREIKLFVQCAITGCIFTGGCLLFFTTGFMAKDAEKLRYAYLSLQLIWAGHHMQNPIIYFAFNYRLRQRFFGMFRRKQQGQTTTQ